MLLHMQNISVKILVSSSDVRAKIVVATINNSNMVHSSTNITEINSSDNIAVIIVGNLVVE